MSTSTYAIQDSDNEANSQSLTTFQTDLITKLQSPLSQILQEIYVPVVAGDETWLFNSASISKILIPEAITPVPGAQQHIIGIVNVTGTIYTLVDFNILLGKRPVATTSKRRTICLDPCRDASRAGVGRSSQGFIALCVDKVLDLIDHESIGPHIKKTDQRYSVGTATIDKVKYHIAADHLISLIPQSLA